MRKEFNASVRVIDDYRALQYGDMIYMSGLGGTDSWAYGEVHSIDSDGLNLRYNEDELQVIHHHMAEHCTIYIVDLFSNL